MLRDVKMIGSYAIARATTDPVKRVRRLYGMYIPEYLFSDDTSYINYGYWAGGLTTLDQAGAAMADLLADRAGIQPDETVLDVGFGYGQQDFTWIQERKPKHISGLNITVPQVRAAQERARREGLDDRLDFRIGSATRMPFEDAVFDRVVALECSFHFFPRSAFLAEALRVLKPGGTLATTDVGPLSNATPRSAFHAPPLAWVSATVDDENWYDRATYAQRLSAAGFEGVEVTSIREDVFEPWRRYMVARLAGPDFRDKVGRIYHRTLTRMWSDQEALKRELALLDYVTVVARKPLTASAR